MKHQHEADFNVNVDFMDIPTQDLDYLIDKVKDTTITLVVVVTIAQILKFHLTR